MIVGSLVRYKCLTHLLDIIVLHHVVAEGSILFISALCPICGFFIRLSLIRRPDLIGISGCSKYKSDID